MRSTLIPFSFWLLALQLPFPASAIHTLTDLGEFLSVAAALAAFTVAVYRLGVWRQEMHNTKDNVGAEIARHRAEVDRRIARIEQRVEKAEGGRMKAETDPAAGGQS